MKTRINLWQVVAAIGLTSSVVMAQEPAGSAAPAEAAAPAAIPEPAFPSLTVTDFGSDEPNDMTHGLPELISDALVNSGLFDVYERDRLATLIQEQNLQTSGMVDANTAISIGKLAGVKYIVTGKIMSFGRELKTFNGYGANTQTAFYRLKAEIRLIDVETGKILFATPAEAEQKEFNASAYDGMNTTMGSKLAEIVSKKLVNAMLSQAMFKPTASAVAEKVAVTISSNPDGADVEVDGVFLGNAGSEFKISAGMHEVKVSLPGYEEWAKKVDIQPGSAFKANLIKKADLRVEVEQKSEVVPVETPAPAATPAEGSSAVPAVP